MDQAAGASRISNKLVKSNKPVKRFAVWLNPRVALIIDPAAPLEVAVPWLSTGMALRGLRARCCRGGENQTASPFA